MSTMRVPVHGFNPREVVGYAIPLTQPDPSKPGWDFNYYSEESAQRYGQDPLFKLTERSPYDGGSYIQLLNDDDVTQDQGNIPPHYPENRVHDTFTPEMIGKVVEIKRRHVNGEQEVLIVGTLQQYSALNGNIMGCSFVGDGPEDAFDLLESTYTFKIRVLEP